MKAIDKSINSEEIIFYIDLTSDFIKKEILKDTIQEFIETKLSLGNSSFGIVIFQEEDNPISLYDDKESTSILKIIDDKWDTRPKNQSYIENGLFEILSYIFRKSREVKKVYRVIVVSDTPSIKSEEYHSALYNLIMKSKNLDFLTIIDIIRVGEHIQYEDEVKIKVITSETEGGFFLCNDTQQFKDVLSSLIKNKREFNIIRPDEEQKQYLEEDKIFYERLAVDLISLSPEDEENCSICQLELCPICGAYSDEIHKCYNCGSKFHGCCSARYAIMNNFGYNHIFRCPQCETLLKLDEEYVNLVYDEEFKTSQILEIEEGPIQETLEIKQPSYESEQPTYEGEEVIHKAEKEQDLEETSYEEYQIEETYEEDEIIEEKFEKIEAIASIPSPPSLRIGSPAPSPPSLKTVELPPNPPSLKKVRVGGYFGQEIVVDKKLKSTKLKIIELPETPRIEEKKSITQLKPPKKRTTIKFCKICGCSVVNVICCPNCGANID